MMDGGLSPHWSGVLSTWLCDSRNALGLGQLRHSLARLRREVGWVTPQDSVSREFVYTRGPSPYGASVLLRCMVGAGKVPVPQHLPIAHDQPHIRIPQETGTVRTNTVLVFLRHRWA